MRIARRFKLDAMAALLGVLAGLVSVCPCLPPASIADASAGDHTCCPGGPTTALTSPAPECCGDHALGGKAVATHSPAIPLPTDVGAVPAARPIASAVAFPSLAPVPFVSIPPLVLRI